LKRKQTKCKKTVLFESKCPSKKKEDERIMEVDHVYRKAVHNVYSMYNREHELCQTNGHFSLNLTKKSVANIMEILNVSASDTIGWIGFGDGRELFAMATQYPNNSFIGFEINEAAVTVAHQVLSKLKLKNVVLKHADALLENATFSIVYSTAIAGVSLYSHLLSMSTNKICMLQRMWNALDKVNLNILNNSLKTSVRLCGSGQQMQIMCMQKLDN